MKSISYPRLPLLGWGKATGTKHANRKEIHYLQNFLVIDGDGLAGAGSIGFINGFDKKTGSPKFVGFKVDVYPAALG
jgi:hypothetical protein